MTFFAPCGRMIICALAKPLGASLAMFAQWLKITANSWNSMRSRKYFSPVDPQDSLVLKILFEKISKASTSTVEENQARAVYPVEREDARERPARRNQGDAER